MNGTTTDATIDAGLFGEWLARALRVLRGEAESDVPCGSCTACCTAAYYIRIRPRDRVGVAGISRAYFVEAEGMPPDETLMGWRGDNSCPALEDFRCTIYGQRPMTCRDYDCRVFVPAGLSAGDERKARIDERVRAWRFRFEGDAERRAFEAIGRAARFIRDRRECFPQVGAGLPTAPTGIAVLALKTFPVFLRPGVEALNDSAIAQSILDASRDFDTRAR